MTALRDGWAVCNGIEGPTGRYALAPTALATIADRLRRAPRSSGTDPDTLRWHPSPQELTRLGDLRRMGWAVVLPTGTPDAVRDALMPLIEHRRAQSGDRFKVLDYNPRKDDFRTWLERHDVGPGDPNRDCVPLHLLLIGEPDLIPFEVQYLLNTEYSVGRLAFDSPPEYAAYAESVIEYELARSALAQREIVYWSPAHDGDVATQLTSEQLVSPLVRGDPHGSKTLPPAKEAGFRATAFERGDAMKQSLVDTFHRPDGALPPAMIFTASHGVGWPKDHAQQRDMQGALLAQDWPPFEPACPSHYISAPDIEARARVHGLVAFMFACFGAGAPEWDSFHEIGSAERIAQQAFVAALPKRLLAHPNGGALAVIGHVDRSWGFSILPRGDKRRIGPFIRTVETILQGHAVGLATRNLTARHATLSASLAQMLADRNAPSDYDIATAWIEHNDARSYVLLGDPAVRLSPAALA